MVNTELNSGNFLIDPQGVSSLVDWEKPLVSEPGQDLGHFLAPTTTFWKTDGKSCFSNSLSDPLDFVGIADAAVITDTQSVKSHSLPKKFCQ